MPSDKPKNEQEIDQSVQASGEININLTGAIMKNSPVIVKSKIKTLTFNNVTNASQQQQNKLEELKQQIIAELEKLPGDKQAEAEAITTQMEALTKQAEAEVPNKPLLRITGDGLIAAATTVAAIAPSIMIAARSFVDLILSFHGG